MGMGRSDYVRLSAHRSLLCVLDDNSLFWLARDVPGLEPTIECWCYRYDWAGDYVSPRQCLGDRTAEVYGLAVATAKGGGAFTLAGPGVSSAGGIGRYLSLTSLLSEQMKWYTTRGLVVPEWCARHISLLHRKIHELQQAHHVQQTLRCRRNKGPLLDWGLWRMFKPMFGWWKMRNPERDWFLGGPRFELWNLKDKTPKRPRPNRRGSFASAEKLVVPYGLWDVR